MEKSGLFALRQTQYISPLTYLYFFPNEGATVEFGNPIKQKATRIRHRIRVNFWVLLSEHFAQYRELAGFRMHGSFVNGKQLGLLPAAKY